MNIINKQETYWVLNNYIGKILIYNLHFGDSQWQHSLLRNCIAIWNNGNYVDSLSHSVDIHRMSRSSSQWNQQDTCQLADKNDRTWFEKRKLTNVYYLIFSHKRCYLVCENIIPRTTLHLEVIFFSFLTRALFFYNFITIDSFTYTSWKPSDH